MRSSLLRPPGEKAEKGHFRSDKSNKSGEHDLSIIKRTIDRWRGWAFRRPVLPVCCARLTDGKLASTICSVAGRMDVMSRSPCCMR